MAFQSLVKTSDYDVYTKKYLQNLALQIQLNQNNFDKNVGYFKTGVQDTERPDSRSIEERAGDVEKLKVQARVMLNKISDATNTNEVLDYLTKNGELLFFFIQQFPAIEKLVKKQYVGGIRAPILISMIYKRFISQQEDSLMPESADFDIVSKVMSIEDAMVLENQTQNAQLKENLTTLAKNLPSQQEKQKLLNDPAGNKDEIKFVAELFKNSPNVDDYNRLIEEYNDAPLKDEITNYDLKRAEEVMLETITAFLEEKIQFQESESNTRRVEEIQKTNKKRTTRQLPVAKDTRLVPISEQERTSKRAIRKAGEYIKETQFNLKPVGERVIKPAKPTLLSELKTTPTLKPSNTKISNVSLSNQLEQEKLSQKVEQESQQRNKAFAELTTAKIGKPKGSKNRSKEVIEQEKLDKEERLLKSLLKSNEKKQALLDNRLLEIQLPTPIKTPPVETPVETPVEPPVESKITKFFSKKPTPIGKGLLNKQEQLSHRFKVLKGEILAGNTASQVIKEMRSLVKQLVNTGELSKEQHDGILKELKTL